MVDAVSVVIGNGVESEDGVDRISMLATGLREGLTLLRVHCRKHWAKAFVPENKTLLATLIDQDMKRYSQRLFAAVVAVAKSRWPMFENIPTVVIPTCPSLSPYIRRRGLSKKKGFSADCRSPALRAFLSQSSAPSRRVSVGR